MVTYFDEVVAVIVHQLNAFALEDNAVSPGWVSLRTVNVIIRLQFECWRKITEYSFTESLVSRVILQVICHLIELSNFIELVFFNLSFGLSFVGFDILFIIHVERRIKSNA